MKDTLTALGIAIRAFERIDIGYPKGDHYVVRREDPASVTQALSAFDVSWSSSLIRFYQLCDGIRLPDVANGYTLYSLQEFVSVNQLLSEPNRLDDGRRCLIVGVDGGGNRFALLPDTDEIVYLPNARVSNDRTYEGTKLRPIAANLEGLVKILLEETRAAVA
jgi:hypothetical protein